MLSDELVIEKLNGEEFKAWSLFLLRVKAEGSRGSAKIASHSLLERSWCLPPGTIASMLEKVDGRIYEEGGRWYVRNWSKYQDDHQSKTASSRNGENPEDARNGTTPPYPTLHYTTPQEKARKRAGVVDKFEEQVPEKDVLSLPKDSG